MDERENEILEKVEWYVKEYKFKIGIFNPMDIPDL